MVKINKLIDLHTHPFSHGEEYILKNYSKEYLNKFTKEAEKKDINVIGFSDHDIFVEQIDWKIMKNISEKSNLDVLLGLEFDYRPEDEDKIKNITDKYKLDYKIGSVHYIDDWNLDHPDNKNDYKQKNIEKLYIKYFNLVNKAAKSDLFDIIGHIDLIKIFDYHISKQKLIEIIKPVLKTIKRKDLIIEINTNGLNKPVQELYPSRTILKIIYDYKIPVTLGSDAHRYSRIGENFIKTIKLIKNIGFKKLTYKKQNKFFTIDI